MAAGPFLRAGGLALAALVAAGLASPASRAESFDFAAGDAYPPFTGPDLPGRGLAVEVVQEALASQGHEADVVLRPRTRAYRRAMAGEYDGTFPFPWTAARAIDAEFSKPLFEVVPQVVSHADSPVPFDGSADSLAGKRVCLAEGQATVALIHEMLADGRLERISPGSVTRCPDLVQIGRADFWVQNDIVRRWAVRQAAPEPGDLHVAEAAFDSVKLHLLVSSDHPRAQEIIRVVDGGLVAIRTDGTFERLVEKHVGGGG